VRRKNFLLLTGLLAAVVAGGQAWTANAPEQGGSSMSGEVDVAAGKLLYAANCAVCHGADLEGQENWQSPGPDGRLPAPPHDETGHTWHHGDRLLFDYTKFGGRAVMAAQGIEFNSGMPGFDGQLSDEEIRNILGFIKSTWPERIRAMQAARTEAETLTRGN
jgi:mono/diheme cytochrome c family protein